MVANITAGTNFTYTKGLVDSVGESISLGSFKKVDVIFYQKTGDTLFTEIVALAVSYEDPSIFTPNTDQIRFNGTSNEFEIELNKDDLIGLEYGYLYAKWEVEIFDASVLVDGIYSVYIDEPIASII